MVFKLKFPSASLLDNLASPWNVIFPKKYLDKDPNHFKTNVVGSGPFKLKSYTRGSTFEGERNPDYFVKDRPYLDGYKFFISTETSVRAAAIRSGRAYIEFRDLPLSEVDAIKKQLGDKVVVQETPMVGQFGIAMQQHGEAVHRHPRPQGADAGLRPLHGRQGALPAHGPEGRRRRSCVPAPSGRCRRPSSRRSRASGETPRRAGPRPRSSWPRPAIPNGFKVVMKNRNVKLPYQDFAVFVIQEWRKIGIEVENRPLETRDLVRGRPGHRQLRADHLQPTVEFMDDPDQFLNRYTPGPRPTTAASPTPRSTTCSRARRGRIDPAERKKLVIELQKRVLEHAYYMPGLWWTRRVVHWPR